MDDVDELCRIGFPVQRIVGGWSAGVHHLSNYLHQVRVVLKPGRAGCIPGVGNSEAFHETAQALVQPVHLSLAEMRWRGQWLAPCKLLTHLCATGALAGWRCRWPSGLTHTIPRLCGSANGFSGPPPKCPLSISWQTIPSSIGANHHQSF